MNIDELIDQRLQARKSRQWKQSDKIRDLLDSELVFVFDGPNDTQEVYYLTDKYFAKKPKEMTNRRFLEQRIQSDIRAEKNLNAWLFTINSNRIRI